jgi:two-component system, cell cycle sensor histidine kinase and response regulator CckA
VEDALVLREMIQEVLEASGYTVLGSSEPEEGILRAGQGGPLDLIVTDVVMPRMSGPDLVKVVQGTRPGVKVLFMSGYTNEAVGRHGVLDADTHFLQKPFSTDALLVSVRRALDELRPLL